MWGNGIHHGDISFNNLMYDVSAETGNLVGIVNDFDLATWVDHPTTNDDRTGTIPFMAIDLLNGGLDNCIPRLYRHGLESFIWVLVYITVAYKQYKGRTIKMSPLEGVDTWFKDRDKADRNAHILSKRVLHLEYGYSPQISEGYYCYHSVVQRMIQYWDNFHQSMRDMKRTIQPRLLDTSKPVPKKPAPDKAEVDDPADSLRRFITTVENSSGGGGVGEGFAEVKTLLLEAIETPFVTVKAV